jgi:hypothetical protein
VRATDDETDEGIKIESGQNKLTVEFIPLTKNTFSADPNYGIDFGYLFFDKFIFLIF